MRRELMLIGQPESSDLAVACNAMTVPDGEMAIGVAATVATAYAIAALLAGTWLTEHRDAV